MKKQLEDMIKKRQVRIFSSKEKKNLEVGNLSYYNYGYDDHKFNAKDLLLEEPANAE